MNPKIQIKNFSGMNENGSYYLEGFSARQVNGQSILSPTWRQSDYINDADTGFTSLGTLIG